MTGYGSRTCRRARFSPGRSMASLSCLRMTAVASAPFQENARISVRRWRTASSSADKCVAPWHHARFSLQTGEAIGAPAFEPLETFQVDRRGDRLFVKKSAAWKKSPSPALEKLPSIVIVGGGGGGFCLRRIAQPDRGFGHSVTIVSDDPDPPLRSDLLLQAIFDRPVQAR